ncbi:hypothetical protein ABZ557_09975 [Streptomyces sp. NPDC019645]|uniref:hypothetical protein n=1 Tax=Streptomyces sp. NPDC019645 TaxID=3154786 RepID=UPI0033E98F21
MQVGEPLLRGPRGAERPEDGGEFAPATGAPVLTLTAGGRDALGKVTGRATERHRELFADVPDEEVAAARSLLRRLLTEPERQERTAGKR